MAGSLGNACLGDLGAAASGCGGVWDRVACRQRCPYSGTGKGRTGVQVARTTLRIRKHMFSFGRHGGGGGGLKSSLEIGDAVASTGTPVS